MSNHLEIPLSGTEPPRRAYGTHRRRWMVTPARRPPSSTVSAAVWLPGVIDLVEIQRGDGDVWFWGRSGRVKGGSRMTAISHNRTFERSVLALRFPLTALEDAAGYSVCD